MIAGLTKLIDRKKMKPGCFIHSIAFIFSWFLSFGVSIFSYVQSTEESFGSSANGSNRKINLSGSEFLVKSNFSWKMISAKQRLKKKGKCQAPTKHELSHSTVKISNRTATPRNSIYFNKHRQSLENIKHKTIYLPKNHILKAKLFVNSPHCQVKIIINYFNLTMLTVYKKLRF